MTTTTPDTGKIAHEIDIAISALGYANNAITRIHLMSWRNAARKRADDLEGRLTTADEKFPHGELDAMPHTDFYLDLLHEYEQAHDAMTRADASL